MRKYRIFKTHLGFGIYKKYETEDGKITQMRFLDGKGKWVLNKDIARNFYHKEDAEGVLGVIKMKDGKDAG